MQVCNAAASKNDIVPFYDNLTASHTHTMGTALLTVTRDCFFPAHPVSRATTAPQSNKNREQARRRSTLLDLIYLELSIHSSFATFSFMQVVDGRQWHAGCCSPVGSGRQRSTAPGLQPPQACAAARLPTAGRRLGRGGGGRGKSCRSIYEARLRRVGVLHADLTASPHSSAFPFTITSPRPGCGQRPDLRYLQGCRRPAAPRPLSRYPGSGRDGTHTSITGTPLTNQRWRPARAREHCLQISATMQIDINSAILTKYL